MADRETDVEVFAKRRLGTVLRGKYRLDRLLGVGGMAVVYKATHRNQAEFAVKMLHPELSMREDVKTRFLREGYAANSVKHPGAVLVVDDDVAEDGAAFLVMELLDGEGVDALWERHRHRLGAREAAAIVSQLLDVLASAHAKGIVHRDIKPANLFVTRNGTVKVLDFGIARARDAAASGANAGSATGTGMLLGTPAYMPPEQALAKSKEIDGQTDVWAAGATLFTLVSGHLVHEGDNAPQLMVKAATTQARSVSSVAPFVPPAIASVIDRALAFDKASRWSSAAAMRDALDAACAATFGQPPSTQLLAASLRESSEALAATATSGGFSGQAIAPTRDATPAPVPAASFPQDTGRLPGGTTAQPISSSMLASVPGVRSTTRIFVSLAAAAVLVVGAGVVVLLRGGSHQSGPASPAADSIAAVSASAPPAPAPIVLAPAAAPSVSAPSASTRVAPGSFGAPTRPAPGRTPASPSAQPPAPAVPVIPAPPAPAAPPPPPVATPGGNPLDIPIK